MAIHCPASPIAAPFLLPLLLLLSPFVVQLNGISFVPSPLGFINPFIEGNLRFGPNGRQFEASPISPTPLVSQTVPGWLLSRNVRGSFFSHPTVAFYRSMKPFVWKGQKKTKEGGKEQTKGGK